MILLAVAGNETTRNAMTHGMNAFFDNPDQWELFKRERPETAADEIVRWATPVHCFQRTALADTELGGVTIREGQRVGLFYSSANYDEAVFDRPFEFNILRDPNPHLGFGGNGAHFCIGANLARMEIKLIFNEIADQIPNIAKLSEPQRLRSGWINGVKDAAGLLPGLAVGLFRRAHPRLVWLGARQRRGSHRPDPRRRRQGHRRSEAPTSPSPTSPAPSASPARRSTGTSPAPTRCWWRRPCTPPTTSWTGWRHICRASPIRSMPSPRPSRPRWSGCRRTSTSAC